MSINNNGTVFSHDLLISAAFLMEGLRDEDAKGGRVRYNEAISNFDEGCIEFISYLMEYIPFLHRLVDAAEIDHHRPGVLDYEVTSRFGHWYVMEITNEAHAPTPTRFSDVNGDAITGVPPSREECVSKLRDFVFEFYSKPDREDGKDASALRSRIDAVEA